MINWRQIFGYRIEPDEPDEPDSRLYFMIKHDDEDWYWNNQFGWVDMDEEGDIFTEEEREHFNLPIHGVWIIV
jgi:hypothetical protein